MDSKYSDFLEKNPTFQDRVEAFTSGLVTPDPKAIVLWAMEEGVFYTVGELHRQVKEFVGGPLPISYIGMWGYCRGNGQGPGVLERFGHVTNDEDGGVSGPFAYAKTPAGADFGDAIAARALQLSRKLTSKYRSMRRILGSARKSEDQKARRGFAVYRVVKLLAEQPEQVFRKTDVADLSGVSTDVVSLVLNTLGAADVIDYESPQRDQNGQTATGWARYWLVNEDLLNEDTDELYAQLREERPGVYLKGYLQCVLDYIRDHPQAVYSANMFPRKTVATSYFGNILSFLKSKGFLESDFEGGVIQSRARANQNTGLLWDHLLKPIEAIAHRLDPSDCRGLYDAWDFYASHPKAKGDHIQGLMTQYQAERIQKGLEAAQGIDAALLVLPKKTMKLSAIVQSLNRTREFSLSTDLIRYHLNGLVRSGRFEKPGTGRYRRL